MSQLAENQTKLMEHKDIILTLSQKKKTIGNCHERSLLQSISFASSHAFTLLNVTEGVF